jgi:hypothetical protein
MAGYKVGSEYDKLKFNPMVLSRQQRMWEVYPEFKNRKLLSEVPDELKDHMKPIEFDKLLRFMVLFVDPTSPFVDEKDFDIRQKLCLNALGYDVRNLFYRQHIRNFSEYFVDVLISYFQMIHNVRYEQWFTTIVSYRRTNFQMMSGQIPILNQKAVAEVLANYVETLTVLESKLFPDEYTKKMMADRATQGLSGYAEKYAIVLEET